MPERISINCLLCDQRCGFEANEPWRAHVTADPNCLEPENRDVIIKAAGSAATEISINAVRNNELTGGDTPVQGDPGLAAKSSNPIR